MTQNSNITTPLAGTNNTNTSSNNNFINNDNSQHHQRGSAGMSRVLAHSTSLLANDSYIAGMSSDSELTTSRHHHRPYSSQSRVYHAHPVPRSSHTSSRVSHYSDSAATSYVPSANKIPPYDANSSVNNSGSSGNTINQQLQYHPHNQPHSVGNPHLTHQGSVTSPSGSANNAPAAASGAYYPASSLANISDPTASSSRAPHQQQGVSPLVSSRPIITSSGRQLPHRPFKQSQSIDHHSGGHYNPPSQHHTRPVHHQHLGSGMSARQPSSPHFDSIDMSAAYQQQQQQPHKQTNYSSSGFEGQTSQQRSMQHDPLARYDQTRNFRPEMDMIEKQTTALRLYDTSDPSSLPPLAGRAPGPSSSSPRHLPPASPVNAQSSLSSMEHLQHQLGQHQAIEAHQQGQQARKHPQHHHTLDLYQQYSSPSPSSHADWLPPMGMSGHHSGRATNPNQQFKQTMSIDQYPVAIHQQQQPQQQQQHFYSPNRTAQYFGEHYRSSLSYSNKTNSPVGNYAGSPTHHQMPQAADYTQQAHQQSAPGSFDHQSAPPPVSVDPVYHQYTNRDQRLMDGIPREHHHLHESSYQHSGPASNLSYGGHQDLASPSTVGASKIQGQQQLPSNPLLQQQQHSSQPQAKLQHQISSSSSNSHSGSLRSSNADLNKSSSIEQAHKSSNAPPYSQQQQQQQRGSSGHSEHHQHHQPGRHHGVLRKGYTSVVSSLGGSVTALNESQDLSPSHASPLLHLISPKGGVANKRYGLRATSPSAPLDTGTGAGRHQHHHHHSSTSKEAPAAGSRSESSTGLPNGASGSSTLTKKSNSATQLSMTGTKKRLGFRRKQVTSFSVHRSEEVAPLEARHLVKQGSSVSEGDSSMSGDSSSRSWSNSNFKQPTSDELASMNFIDGLGKGQMISRQGLASPYLGDIQLSLCDRRGNLEVEIIRARNLQAKTNKVLPLTYVKLYLVKNRKCLAKAKTTLSNKRTLDPLFQQQLTFHEDYHGCILQSIIWGNFGKMDKKNFMGIAQISIDDLELSDTVISWYKLFLPSSLQTLPSKSLRHTLLSNSTESFTNTNNS